MTSLFSLKLAACAVSTNGGPSAQGFLHLCSKDGVELTRLFYLRINMCAFGILGYERVDSTSVLQPKHLAIPHVFSRSAEG